MDLIKITKLEEIHTPTEAHFFCPDGLGDEWVEVCSFCDAKENHYAALWPCPTMEDAYYQYEQDNN